MTPSDLLNLLGSYRLPTATEAELQTQIAGVLWNNGIEHEREVRLAPGDRIDFLVSGTGIEVKIKGGKRPILRQLERYATSPRISGLLLVTGVALGLPAEIRGKPVAKLSIGRAWI